VISLYIKRQSWLHRLPAGLKLLALAAVSLLALPLDQAAQLAALPMGAALLYASLGGDGWRALRSLSPLLPFLAMLLLFHWLLGDVWAGLLALMRLLGMVMLANLVTVTTRMDDMLAALEPFFRPLQWLGLPSRRLSLAVTMMIRFTQVLYALFEALEAAWRARGGGRPGVGLIAPFLIRALDMTDNFSDALTARGGADGLPPEALEEAGEAATEEAKQQAKKAFRKSQRL